MFLEVKNPNPCTCANKDRRQGYVAIYSIKTSPNRTVSIYVWIKSKQKPAVVKGLMMMLYCECTHSQINLR